MKILVIDVGGTHVKIMVTGRQEEREVPSGPGMTAKQMVDDVLEPARDWEYDVVTIGYPGPVLHNRPLLTPHNVGPGWVGFDFGGAFGRPVKVMNDAGMQALGSHEDGRKLFLGLGIGLGSAMIVDNVLQSMESGHLPYKEGRTLSIMCGRQAGNGWGRGGGSVRLMTWWLV
jgi:polyphosphate glucokinase